MRSTIQHLIVPVLLLSCALPPAFAQVNPAWTAQITGAAGQELMPLDAAVNTSGDVYVVGYDAGAERLHVSKVSKSGVLLWSYDHGSPGALSRGVSVAITPDDGVVVCGYIWRPESFGQSGFDYLTVALDGDGGFRWSAEYDGAGRSDIALYVVAESGGDVYVTGASHGVGELRRTGRDIVTIAYDADGNQQWNHRYDGEISGNDLPVAALIDASGGLVVAGTTMRAHGAGIVALKYGASGEELWTTLHDDTTADNRLFAAAPDPRGGVVLGGSSSAQGGSDALLLVRIGADGGIVWTQKDPEAGSAVPTDLVVDASGNTVVVASMRTSQGDMLAVTSRYDGDGVRQWLKSFDAGPAAADTGAPVFHGATAVLTDHPWTARLHWAPAVDERTGADSMRYNIYISEPGGSIRYDAPVATTAPGAGSHTLTGLEPGVRYQAAVRAVDEAGNENQNMAIVEFTPGDGLKLEGDAQPVSDAIPDLEIPSIAAADFRSERGATISDRRLMLMFDSSSVVGDANTLLHSIGATIIGSVQGFDLLLVQLPEMPRAQWTTLMQQLELHPEVDAVIPDAAGSDYDMLAPHSPAPNDWIWNTNNQQGVWRLDMIRAPTVWNLDTWMRRNRSNVAVTVGILEPGKPDANHPDLNFEPGTTDNNSRHSTAVAGVIGGNWLNNAGIEGVNPWLAPIVMSTTEVPANQYSRSRKIWDLHRLLRNPSVRVINHSMGLIVHTPGLRASNVVTANNTERVIERWADGSVGRSNFLIVASAGNNGNDRLAIDNSEFASLAARGRDRYIAVEALDPNGAAAGFSVLSGSVSAPGQGVVTTVENAGYGTVNGTSFAVPHVAGLASLLWSVEPGLTHTQVRSLLTDDQYTAETLGGSRPRIDAFAAVMGIDAINGRNDLHRALVDVDDGSALDGNARIDHDDEDGDGDFTEAYEAARPPGVPTADRRRGDGQINMKDFRAFRDAYLLAVVGNTDGLDGPDSHFKFDLNFDGVIDSNIVDPPHPAGTAGTLPGGTKYGNAPDENTHPRYDFNGNGRIEADNALVVPTRVGLEPFKIDPDTECLGLFNPAGCMRDIDVLAAPGVWSIDAENVTHDDAQDGVNTGDSTIWQPRMALRTDRDGDNTIDYLNSADIHFTLGPDEFEMSWYRIIVKTDLGGNNIWTRELVIVGTITEQRTLILTVPIGSDAVTVTSESSGLDLYDPYFTTWLFETGDDILEPGEDARVLMFDGP